MEPIPLCGYWVSRSADDPDAHVCAREAAYVASPDAPHTHEDGDELALCQVHATEKRLAALKARGYAVRFIDND
jgi:hypothetical protein